MALTTEIIRHDPTKATEFNIKFQNSTETKRFGFMTEVQAETTINLLALNEEGVLAGQLPKVASMQITLDGHIDVDALRTYYGMSNKDLKDGVFAYGSASVATPFCLTYKSLDELHVDANGNPKVKLVAYPNCTSNAGVTIDTENGTDTVADVELTADAFKDENGNIYYEAFEDELDEELAEQWMIDFSPELVALNNDGSGDESPDAPKDLEATAKSDTSASLAWK